MHPSPENSIRMKKLLFLLMFALGTGAAQAQVKFETKSTDAVREMAIKQG